MTSRRINVKAAADYLGISKSLLDKWRMSPEALEYQRQMYGSKGGSEGPPFIRIGKRIVYDTASLDAWMGVRNSAQNSAQNSSLYAQNPDVWDIGP